MLLSPPQLQCSSCSTPRLELTSPSLKIRCSSSKDGRGISRTARIRDEVISPFRSVRMFLYPALMASATIAGITAIPRLVAALTSSQTAELPLEEVLQGLGIDAAAFLFFAFLYRSDSKARELQLAKLSREESLASLRVELPDKRIATLEKMRGSARFVIIAGPKSHVDQAIRLSMPLQKELMERGVTLVPFVTQADDSSSSSGAEDTAGEDDPAAAAARRWIVTPIYTSEWSSWINEQKRLANIPEDKPVYLSLRMDGRVRGSGVGSPPWNALVAQLPPLKGIWRGAFDGMDGRV